MFSDRVMLIFFIVMVVVGVAGIAGGIISATGLRLVLRKKEKSSAQECGEKSSPPI